MLELQLFTSLDGTSHTLKAEGVRLSSSRKLTYFLNHTKKLKTMNKGKMVCTVAAQKCVCVYACVHPCMCMCERDDGDDTLLYKGGVRERVVVKGETDRQTDRQREI